MNISPPTKNLSLLLCALCVLCGGSFSLSANLDIRYLARTQIVGRATVPDAAPVRFYRGESVTFDLWLRTPSAPFSLAGMTVVPKWRIADDSDTGTSLMLVQGTVTNSTSGWCRFSASPSDTAMPATSVWSYVELYQVTGGTTNRIGVAHRARCDILGRSTTANWTGPYSTQSLAPSYDDLNATGAVWLASANSYTDAHAAGTTDTVARAHINTGAAGVHGGLWSAAQSAATNYYTQQRVDARATKQDATNAAVAVASGYLALSGGSVTGLGVDPTLVLVSPGPAPALATSGNVTVNGVIGAMDFDGILQTRVNEISVSAAAVVAGLTNAAHKAELATASTLGHSKYPASGGLSVDGSGNVSVAAGTTNAIASWVRGNYAKTSDLTAATNGVAAGLRSYAVSMDSVAPTRTYIIGSATALSSTYRFADFGVYLSGNWTPSLTGFGRGCSWDITVAHSGTGHVITWPAGIKVQTSGIGRVETNATGYTDWYTLYARSTNSIAGVVTTNLFVRRGIQ